MTLLLPIASKQIPEEAEESSIALGSQRLRQSQKLGLVAKIDGRNFSRLTYCNGHRAMAALTKRKTCDTRKAPAWQLEPSVLSLIAADQAYFSSFAIDHLFICDPDTM